MSLSAVTEFLFRRMIQNQVPMKVPTTTHTKAHPKTLQTRVYRALRLKEDPPVWAVEVEVNADVWTMA